MSHGKWEVRSGSHLSSVMQRTRGDPSTGSCDNVQQQSSEDAASGFLPPNPCSSDPTLTRGHSLAGSAADAGWQEDLVPYSSPLMFPQLAPQGPSLRSLVTSPTHSSERPQACSLRPDRQLPITARLQKRLSQQFITKLQLGQQSLCTYYVLGTGSGNAHHQALPFPQPSRGMGFMVCTLCLRGRPEAPRPDIPCCIRFPLSPKKTSPHIE